MKEIKEIIKKVVSSNMDWTFSMFFFVIDKLREKDIKVSFWEDEENWASILLNNKTVGYIWKKFPLIILEKEEIPNFKNLVIEYGPITYIEVESLNKDLFSLEDDDLKSYFNDSLDFNSFTMEDLWYNTNSV